MSYRRPLCVHLLGACVVLVGLSATKGADDFVTPPKVEREAVAVLTGKGLRVRINSDYRVITVALDPNSTNDDVKLLASFEKLWGVEINSPQITDACLEDLKSLASLTTTTISTPGITDTAIAEWRKARPNLRISDARPGARNFGTATAGFGGPSGPGFTRSPASLASIPPVQDDLKLSPDQRQQIREASQVGDLAAIMRVRDEKIMAVLNDEQRARLKQLELQQLGVSAVVREEVAKELKLSNDQTSAIRKAISEAGSLSPFPQRGRDETSESTAVRMKERDDKILALLSDEQRQAWLAMQGPKGPVFSGLPRGATFGGQASPQETASRLFPRLDVDGDGSLSESEFAGIPEAVRQRMKDAGVTLELPAPREAFEKTYAKYLEESRARR